MGSSSPALLFLPFLKRCFFNVKRGPNYLGDSDWYNDDHDTLIEIIAI